MQPPSATPSHPPHGMSANLIKLCSRNIPQSLTDTRKLFCITQLSIPKHCALPIKGGYEYKTEHTSRSARNTTRKTGTEESIHIRHRLIEIGKQTRNGLGGDWGYSFKTTFLFFSFFSCEFNTYLWHDALVVRMTLLICLYSFSICMFIILIPAFHPAPGFTRSQIAPDSGHGSSQVCMAARFSRRPGNSLSQTRASPRPAACPDSPSPQETPK